MPEQTLGGIPLGLGMVMKINFFEFSCIIKSSNMGRNMLHESSIKFVTTPDSHSQQITMEQSNCSMNVLTNFARIPGEVKVLSMTSLSPSWLVATTDTR